MITAGFILFLICLLTVSGWNMGSIFLIMFTRFNTDSTSIGIRTTYIRWSNTFPSVSICLIKNKITKDFSATLKKRVFEDKPLISGYERNIIEYLFATSDGSSIKEEYCKALNSTCGVNIMELRKEFLPESCEHFFKAIYFAGVPLNDCKTIFKYHVLEMGNCFISNNLIDYKNQNHLPLKYSSLDKDRSLKLVLQNGKLYKYQLYIHSPEDMPYFNTVGYAINLRRTVYNFNIEEIHNTEDVINEAVDQRMCKFPSESISTIFKYRSALLQYYGT
ncbi:uncharacterized protein LOC115483804 [Drosophila hydei]|uniref:Uncharacterized protein LOC115483804 n=1 Tax=Drosophila hydei TaxID=7224 RepID=A0A6J2T1F9_DROHY|nr:uncharacterized protein LOC115483804 [Drosophila hydei]